MGPSFDEDLLDIHNSVLRELPEPSEGREKGPWWLWTSIVIAIFTGGFYLGRYSGAFFQTKVHIGYSNESGTASLNSLEKPENTPLDIKAMGAAIFKTNCLACHTASGDGLPGVFPPLAGSEWVNGDERTLSRILLHGLTGQVEVKGKPYSGTMPGWKDQLKSAEIAAVATYIRSEWGNAANAIDEKLVSEEREKHGVRAAWTAAELLKERETK